MVKTGRHLWKLHPHVDNNRTLGEKASDLLKAAFGTWTLLGLIAAWIIGWLEFVPDEGELHLNLALSCMAAVQGIILQIAANRGDKKAAELALATHANGEQLLELNQQQMTILAQQTQMLTEIKALRAEIGDAKGGEVE